MLPGRQVETREEPRVHPTMTNLIAAERSEDLLRRAKGVRPTEPSVGKTCSPAPRHSLSSVVRRYFRHVSFAR